MATSTNPPQYKLTYYNLGGRGEPIRLLFALARVNFEDNRIEFKQWPALKPTLPWRQIPILQDGKVTISQSKVILKYLGRKFGYAGKTEEEQVKCEEYVDSMSDLMDICIDFNTEKDPVRKAELGEKMLDDYLPFYLGRFNEILKNNEKFLVGQNITFADVYIAHCVQAINSKVRNLLDNYSELVRHQQTIFHYPGIREWVSNRPESRWQPKVEKSKL